MLSRADLCVCLDSVFPDSSTEVLPTISRLGLNRFEFWDWRTRDYNRLTAQAQGYGIHPVVFSGNTFEEPLVDAAVHREALAHFARSIEVARAFGTWLLVAHTGYAIGGRSRAAQWEAAVAGLRAAGELAGAAGITLAVEPLNSVLDHPGYFLDTLPDALRLIDEVGLPSVRLLLDVYHMRMMHGDLLDRLPEALPVTVHVHVADVPGRREPGTGAINWRTMTRALREGGYRGAVGLECWPSGEPVSAVRRAIEELTS